MHRLLAILLGPVLVLAGLSVTPAHAAVAVPHLPPLQQERSVAGTAMPVLPRPPDPAAQHALSGNAVVAWPVGTAEVTVPAAASHGTGDLAPLAPAGALPVAVGAAGGAAAVRSAPARVRVQTLPLATAAEVGVPGALLRVSRADGSTLAAQLSVTVDYSGLRGLYGGDWAARLRLYLLDSCATGGRPCTGRALPGHNDTAGGRITATVPLAAVPSNVDGRAADAGTLLAVVAGASGGTGAFSATSLAPSATWQAGGSTGDFSWSYPLRLPPAIGGPAPQVALSYASARVDGRTASTNNQPSWIGEGFDFWPGYIERQYKSCALDTAGAGNPATGDQCWASDNATMSLSGSGGELVRDSATGSWHLKNDDGSRVEHLTGASNGDNDGEYWKVTTPDGTQYVFGRNRLPGWTSGKPETASTWTVPVYGNHNGEPCHGSTFATSWCQQAWRWNLDEVIDPFGNVIVYYYTAEQNYYARNLDPNSGTRYQRGGYLSRIEYGLRSGEEYTATAAARVIFTVADRCRPGSICTPSQPANWPDTPWDQSCAGITCSINQIAPTFWTTKRLATITTQVWGGSSYRDVDSWTLNHIFPDPGDSTSASLWLESIVHTGLVGGSVSLPEVNFDGLALPNRVDGLEGLPQMNKYRITVVQNETGGSLGVNYAPAECVAGTHMPPNPENNTMRCFPVRWQPPGEPELLDWFHKYVVAQVVEVDRTGGSPTEVTSYEYVGPAAWHYDDNELVADAYRTWGQWRGYGRVRVRHGASGETQSLTETLYFRGMDGDRLPGGGSRSVVVVDSLGESMVDHWRLAGMVREETTYDGSTVVAATITDPWLHQTASANRSWGTQTAYQLDTARVRTRTTLSDGTVRTTEVSRTFDDAGLVSQIDDRGDVAVADDDRCTKITYARNDAAWMRSYHTRIETLAVACTATPSYPADVISDERTYYDGATTFGTPPVHGAATMSERLSGWSAGPVYTMVSQASYDAYGRVTSYTDARGARTTITYTPAAGPVTSTTTTNALGWTSTSYVEPAWGEPVGAVDASGRRTDLEYDPLGRLTKVWLPGRTKAAGDSPNRMFSYLMRTDGAVAVGTSDLRPDGTYQTSYQLYDGRLRERQTQQPAPGGGRVLTDVRYDSRGLVSVVNGPYYNVEAPSTDLLSVADNQVPGQQVMIYDGAEREVVTIFRSLGVERWRTTTTYGGDRISVDPPDGGIATTTISDGLGRVTEVRQYHSGAPSGPYDATRYAYTRSGELASVTNPAGSVWRYTYDLLGRMVSSVDPDRGTTTYTYDDADQLMSTTDSRGRTLAYEYDALGRMVALHDGSPTGPLLVSKVYDTLVKGLVTSSTRYHNGNAYTTAVVGYDQALRPTGMTVTIPAIEGALAGSYRFDIGYAVDGSITSTSLPAMGGLPAETLNYGYDADGMLTTITSNLDTYLGGMLYTKFGEPSRATIGNTKRVWRTYYYEEGTRRLIRDVVDRQATSPRQADVNYTYDAAGTVTRIADTPAGLPADIQCFRHDYLRRLVDAWTATDNCAASPSLSVLGGPAPYWHSYSYDVAGNRLTETRHASGGDTVAQYAYPAADAPQPHAVTSIHVTGPGVDRTDAYGYDMAGNTTARPGQTLTWDAEGHLASVIQDGSTTSFVYDADGNRLIRRDPTGTTLYLPHTELFAPRGGGPVTCTRYYPDGSVRTPNGLSRVIADYHGTETLAFNATDLSVTHRRTTPFGQTRGSVAPWPDERGFVGGTIDASTGLTHLGAREYDPMLGRFISVDPAIDFGDPQQMQGYSYANNSPVTASDPTGMWPDWGGIWTSVTNTVKHAADSAGKFWQEHQTEIVGIGLGVVVGAACTALTAGIAAVGCAALGGAAAGMVTYAYGAFVAKQYQFSWGGLAMSGLVGAASGLLGMGIGKAIGAIGSKVLSTGLGKAASGLVGKAVTGAKGLASRAISGAKGLATRALSSARTLATRAIAGTRNLASRALGQAPAARTPITTTPSKLWVAASSIRPKPSLRKNNDFPVKNGIIPSQAGKTWPAGVSLFKSPALGKAAGVNSKYWSWLDEGTKLPDGLAVIEDGVDVGGPQHAGHATIYPTMDVPLEVFKNLILGLNWSKPIVP